MALSHTLNGTLYTRGHIAVVTTWALVLCWALGLCCALAREVQVHIPVARPHHSRFLLVAVALDLEVDVEVAAHGTEVDQKFSRALLYLRAARRPRQANKPRT